uniref:Cysteine rich with EGF like domains 1 n=1 Tax=Anas platyrhynchos platyrhynchos TaxID=8840 RepID=A0A493TKP6_ANAPP
MDRLALCCPPGTYGPECLPCAGGRQQPCSGNGRCDGEGTRGGTGLCVCSPGYGGPYCAECGDGYYEASRNQSQLLCADIDECGTEMAHCRANQFCVNTEGSYECRDCSTACIGCMGAGPARCKKCNKGYRRDGAKCLGERPLRAGGGKNTPQPPYPEPEPFLPPRRRGRVRRQRGARLQRGAGGVREHRGRLPLRLRPGPRAPGRAVRGGETPRYGWDLGGLGWDGGHQRLSGVTLADAPEKGFFDDVTEDEVVVLQQMFFGVMICALATLAAKGDMVFTAIFIGAVAAMAGYWLSDRSDRVLDGFMKGR